MTGSRRGKAPSKKIGKKIQKQNSIETDKEKNNASCMACNITAKEDLELGLLRTWIQCVICNSWVHSECLTGEIEENEIFACPECAK